MGFPKSKQFVELFEAPKGMLYEGHLGARTVGNLSPGRDHPSKSKGWIATKRYGFSI
jgi:hypothetical protein